MFFVRVGGHGFARLVCNVNQMMYYGYVHLTNNGLSNIMDVMEREREGEGERVGEGEGEEEGEGEGEGERERVIPSMCVVLRVALIR